MYGDRRDASDGDVASWLQRVGARLRELEGENARLKQELADLKRGVGIAVMINGQVVPLALQAPVEHAPTPANQPRLTAAHRSPDLPHITGKVPVPAATRSTVPASAPASQRSQPLPSLSHQSFGPLAATPDELPAVRALVPASQWPARDWLAAGEAWPDPAMPARRARPGATLRTAVTPARGTYPPARTRATSDPMRRDGEHGNGEPSPYADSFIL